VKGRPEFTLPVSLVILGLALIVSIAQATMAIRGLVRARQAVDA
jgi:hypothetical protein